MTESLRFGVAVGATGLHGWQMRCVDDLVRGAHARLVVVLLERTASHGGPLPSVQDDAEPLPQQLAASAGGDVPRIPLIVSEDGRRLLEPAGARHLRSQDLDFVIRFADGPIPAEIARTPRLGVWMYSHGGRGDLDGTPPSMHDHAQRRPTTEARLVRFEPDGRRAHVLHRGTFQVTAHSYARTLDGVHQGIADWAARACRLLARGTSAPSAGVATVRPARSARALRARSAAVQTTAWLRRALHGLRRQEQWHIGVVDAPIGAYVSGGQAPAPRWLPNLSGRFYLADPFGYEHDGDIIIMAEQYDYLSCHGHIVALSDADERSHSRAVPHPTALRLPGHASYPYLFTHEGYRYCVPENHESGALRLYRAALDPHARWTLVAEILHDVAAVDPTIVAHEGRWWLWCTDETRGSMSNLYLYHADAPEGPWMPHRENPVKTDVRTSRPGGTPFVHAGRLYRPAQDCAIRYGSAIVINEVVTLSVDDYDEHPVARVDPDPASLFAQGLHTLSSVGDCTLIDGRCERLLPLSLAGRGIRMLAGRRWSRGGGVGYPSHADL